MHSILAASLLAPNLGLIVWISITFLLLLVLLRKFAWGPILAAIEQREQNITEQMQQAEVARNEARQLLADNERARRDAEQEAQRILREARETAERLRSEDVERTRQQIQEMQRQAAEDIEREKQSALQALRAEVATLAIGAASKVLREEIDGPRQRKLVDNFLNELPSA